MCVLCWQDRTAPWARSSGTKRAERVKEEAGEKNVLSIETRGGSEIESSIRERENRVSRQFVSNFAPEKIRLEVSRSRGSLACSNVFKQTKWKIPFNK